MNTKIAKVIRRISVSTGLGKRFIGDTLWNPLNHCARGRRARALRRIVRRVRSQELHSQQELLVALEQSVPGFMEAVKRETKRFAALTQAGTRANERRERAASRKVKGPGR